MRLARTLNPDSLMEPEPTRLPESGAPRPPVEPRTSCPATEPSEERKFRVLVGVTGSVAALKLPLLVSRLLDVPGLEVAVVTTERAKHFYSPQDVAVTLYSDADEWEIWKQRCDPVLHIDLRRWADLMLVAPLDANTLGKVASGICDNLLVSDLPCPPLCPGLLSCRLLVQGASSVGRGLPHCLCSKWSRGPWRGCTVALSPAWTAPALRCRWAPCLAHGLPVSSVHA